MTSITFIATLNDKMKGYLASSPRLTATGHDAFPLILIVKPPARKERAILTKPASDLAEKTIPYKQKPKCIPKVIVDLNDDYVTRYPGAIPKHIVCYHA